MDEERRLPVDIEEILTKWKHGAFILQSLLVVLGFAGIVSALAVTGFTDSIGTNWTRVLAFLYAVSFALINGFNLSSLSANFLSAWRHLNAACIRYKRVKSFSEEELTKAYEEGEAIIGHIVLTSYLSQKRKENNANK